MLDERREEIRDVGQSRGRIEKSEMKKMGLKSEMVFKNKN